MNYDYGKIVKSIFVCICILIIDFGVCFCNTENNNNEEKIRKEIRNIKKMEDFTVENSEINVRISELIQDFEDKSSKEVNLLIDNFSSKNDNETPFYSFIKVFFQILTFIIILSISVILIANLVKLIKSDEIGSNYKYKKIKHNINIENYKDSFYLSKESYKDGHTKLAFMYLYKAFISKLGKEGYIDYNKSKTSSQYLFELIKNKYERIKDFESFTKFYNDIFFGKMELKDVDKIYLEYLTILRDD